MCIFVLRVFKIGFLIAILVGIVAIGSILFVINGKYLANGEVPLSGVTSYSGGHEQEGFAANEIKIMAYNIAKGFVYKGGISFEQWDVVLERLWQIADLIKREQPDLVFLSETIFECGPSPMNQITFLVEASGMHTWVFGENYNFGFPFYRIVGGNAILSHWPIHAAANSSLAGRKPFYVTENNRRILWAELEHQGETLLLGAVHTDSFNPENNLTQTRQILEYIGERSAILAGDFNANPSEPSLQLIRNSGKFSGEFEGPLTFPAHEPTQTIDFIFAPASWELLDHRVLQSDASDHLPIVSTFRIPTE